MSQPFPPPAAPQPPAVPASVAGTGPVAVSSTNGSSNASANLSANPSTDLQACVRASLQAYFDDLDGETPANMYDMVLRLMELPLLETVMAQADHNQSRAAQWLGLNRNTLRKKLQEHDLL